MKKVFLSLLLVGAVGIFSHAQESVGGIPWSMSKRSAVENQKVAVLNLPTPDYTKARKEDDYNEAIGKPGKYRAALGVKTDINLSSGTYTYLSDGSIIWRLQVSIPTSIAMKIQYDDFMMPKGVTYFVQNGNKNQLIGGYDNTSNPTSKTMAHDMVQGDVVNMEMDIQPGVDLSKIQFQVSRIFGLYRGADNINHTFGDASVQSTYGFGSADTCTININCPVTAPWYTYSNAVAHIWITNSDTAGGQGGWCSGTLIGNTAKDCKAYFLTASHCDEDNSYSNSGYQYWEFTFDLRAPLCTGGGTPNTSKVLKGADFKARSFYTIPPGQSTGPLIGDFILLQLHDDENKLAAWNRYFGGWNRSPQITDTMWIGFHHPAGDVMKFSEFNKLDSTGQFNTGDSLKGTHWAATSKLGGIQGGSSGSGLWEASTGRLIGDLSGGVTPTQPRTCTPGNVSQYSKIYHNWYNLDDTIHFNDTITAKNSRLQPFLDPGNTGAVTMDMSQITPTSCSLTPFNYVPTAINNVELLNNGIALYPNPSTGVVLMTLNLQKAQDLNVEIVNILGQTIASYSIKNASLSQKTNFDLSSYPDGIYLFKISSENASITRKIIIKK